MGPRGSSGLPAGPAPLGDFGDGVSRPFGGFGARGFHRRNGLVGDFLRDPDRGFRHGRHRDDYVVRRLADGLDRGPQGLDRLLERGLEVFGCAVQRLGPGRQGQEHGSFCLSHEVLDLAAGRAARRTVGRLRGQQRSTFVAIHSHHRGVPRRLILIQCFGPHGRLWRATSTSALAWTIPGAYDFTIRVRIAPTSIQRARAASASRRVKASGYCSFGHSSWEMIVPFPRSVWNATSRDSRASKWPMMTQSATCRGATSRQAPSRGMKFVVRLSRVFLTRYRWLTGLSSHAYTVFARLRTAIGTDKNPIPANRSTTTGPGRTRSAIPIRSARFPDENITRATSSAYRMPPSTCTVSVPFPHKTRTSGSRNGPWMPETS